jgi:glucosamine-6-phosphate deaminase
MKITIVKTEREFDIMAAWRIILQILYKPDSVIGLSTGRTTRGIHEIISGIFSSYPFDVSRITLFNVDEITNLSREHPASCYFVIKSQIAGPLGIPDNNFIMPRSISDDFKTECRDFEKKLEERGGVDLQILGIGENGHIGINQPGTPFDRETWITRLDPDSEAQVRREKKVPPETILGGLTRGIKNIMQTRRIILVAKGEHKAEVIGKAVLGKITTDIPASVLQLHPNCEVLLDEDAASLILDKI